MAEGRIYLKLSSVGGRVRISLPIRTRQQYAFVFFLIQKQRDQKNTKQTMRTS